MSKLESPVAIVGAGPCGLMTALLLARAGVRCDVFEKHPGISTHPKAMGVTRRTAEIYRQLGLLDRMLEADFEGEIDLIIWADSLVGEMYGRAPVKDLVTPLSPCVPFHCPQTWTERVLLEAVQAEAFASVHFGHQVSGVEASESGVKLTIHGEHEEWSGDWLVAADGAGSFVRAQLQVETAGPGEMGRFLNVFFQADLAGALRDRRAILYNILRQDLVEFFVSVNGDDEFLMHHFLDAGETKEDYSEERLLSLIRSAAGIADLDVKILGVSPWVMSPKVAMEYRKGRVLFTGDAAARLSPAGGLGLNNGLQSVHNLAWKLAAVVNGDATEGLLDTYHDERHDLAMQVMGKTNENAGEVMAFVELAMKGDKDGLRTLAGKSHRQKAEHGLDIGVAYEEGAFLRDGSEASPVADAVNDYVPGGRPGARFPHAEIFWKGRKCSTLDLFGDGFVAVVGEGSSLGKSGGLREMIRLGPGGDAVCGGDFLAGLGLTENGLILVRPDGYIAFRSNELHTDSSIFLVLEKILRPLENQSII